MASTIPHERRRTPRDTGNCRYANPIGSHFRLSATLWEFRIGSDGTYPRRAFLRNRNGGGLLLRRERTLLLRVPAKRRRQRKNHIVKECSSDYLAASKVVFPSRTGSRSENGKSNAGGYR